MANSNVIEVSSSSTIPQVQTGFVVTLEGTNLFLTVVLSSAALLGMVVKTVSKFNQIASKLRDIEDGLNSHSNAEGHAQLLQQVRQIQLNLIAIDKKIDLHLLDYVNYKDANLLHHNGSREKIDHTWNKSEKLFTEHKAEIKEMQRFLQKQRDFTIRE